jgi:protein-tyrosine phosphatase
MKDALAPFHLQLAGPAARPQGHPDHAFVLDALAIGEYPTPADAVWLRRVAGISTVLSLQDDIDLDRKGLSIESLEAAYAAVGLRFARHPIPDGDGDALRARIDAVVGSLAELLDAGERVYLHCNAGLNRAPTIAIAYIHVARGISLEAACAAIKARRPCVPYMRTLLARYGSG